MKKLVYFAFLVILLAVITTAYAAGGRTVGHGFANNDIDMTHGRGGDDDD